jgi:hypothetical protein
MPFLVTYAHTAFTSLGGNKIRPMKLLKAVKDNVTIVTQVIDFKLANPGSGNTPEVDDPTGRTWSFVFAGAGPLSGPETTALNAIVAAHDGSELIQESSLTMTSGTVCSLGAVQVDECLVRKPDNVIGGIPLTAPRNIVLPSEFTSSSTSIVPVTGWTGISLKPAKIYRFSAHIIFNNTAVSKGTPQLGLYFSGSVYYFVSSALISISGSSVVNSTNTDNSVFGTGTATVTTDLSIFFNGTFKSNNLSSTMEMRMRCGTSSTTTNIKEGSNIQLWQLD